jgi:hypothetical protein
MPAAAKSGVNDFYAEVCFICMDMGVPCKVTLTNMKFTIARAYFSDISNSLEPEMRVVLTIRHISGATVKVMGVVERIIRRRQKYNYVAVRIPWDAAVTLAKISGVTVEKGKKVELYDYAVDISKVVSPPPLR